MKKDDNTAIIQEVEQKAEQLELELALLLDDKGVPILRADLYQSKRDDLVNNFVSYYAEPLAAIDSELSQITAQLGELESVNVTNQLTTDELARANQLKSFLESDVSNLDGATLMRQIEHAIRSQDKPLMYVYSRLLPTRPKSRQTTMPTADGNKTVFVSDEYADDLALLRSQLDDLLTDKATRQAQKLVLVARQKMLGTNRKQLELIKRKATGLEAKLKADQKKMAQVMIAGRT